MAQKQSSSDRMCFIFLIKGNAEVSVYKRKYVGYIDADSNTDESVANIGMSAAMQMQLLTNWIFINGRVARKCSNDQRRVFDLKDQIVAR